MSDPTAKFVDPAGLFRCCAQSLRDATILKDVQVGHVVPCQWCRDGVTWSGAVWIASWRFKAKDAKASTGKTA